MANGNMFSNNGQTDGGQTGGIKMPDFVRPISRQNDAPAGFRHNPFTPPPPQNPPKPPAKEEMCQNKKSPSKLSVGGILNMLGMNGKKFDNDIIVILMLFLIISSDGGDDLLALALAYIIL